MKNYVAQTEPGCKKTDIAISFFASEKELPVSEQRIQALLNNPSQELKQMQTDGTDIYKRFYATT